MSNIQNMVDDSMLRGRICWYCNNPTLFIDSEVVYGKSYGMIYHCAPCRAWVGTHRGTKKALGRVAKYDLRQAKKIAHQYFDNLWKKRITGSCKKNKARSKAYEWLSKEMGIDPEYTHIGMFNIEQCNRVVELCKPYLQ